MTMLINLVKKEKENKEKRIKKSFNVFFTNCFYNGLL